MASIKEKTSDGVLVTEKKYWIKPGIDVCHREYPLRRMIVEKILRQSKKLMSGESEVTKMFVVGVKCHWLSDNGDYREGVFFTRELLPYKETKKEEVEPSGT